MISLSIVAVVLEMWNLMHKSPLTYFSIDDCEKYWSVMAEWLGCRTLNQRVVGLKPGKGTV
jgi:hypothetical protein